MPLLESAKAVIPPGCSSSSAVSSKGFSWLSLFSCFDLGGEDFGFESFRANLKDGLQSNLSATYQRERATSVQLLITVNAVAIAIVIGDLISFC